MGRLIPKDEPPNFNTFGSKAKTVSYLELENKQFFVICKSHSLDLWRVVRFKPRHIERHFPPYMSVSYKLQIYISKADISEN